MDNTASSKGEEVNLWHLSSIVFVGKFSDAMFDEHDLFDGQIDPENHMRAGSIVQCTYASGKYQFRVISDRIDVIAGDSEVTPKPLTEAAQLIAKEIDAARRFVSVTGMGMNCETTFPRHLISESGERYCASLIGPHLEPLISDEPLTTMARGQFNKEPFQYDVRIEPHFQSGGEQLFVAVNGYQALSQTDSLESALKHTDAFREYVKDFHQRVRAHEIG